MRRLAQGRGQQQENLISGRELVAVPTKGFFDSSPSVRRHYHLQLLILVAAERRETNLVKIPFEQDGGLESGR